MLEIGDVVMFDPESKSSYVEYFGGKLAIVISSTINNSGENHVRVEWMEPVKYFDTYTKISDFGANHFIKSS